jgi:hypothetical protein
VRKNTSTFAEFMEDSVVVPGTEPFLLFEDGEITTYWPKKFRLEKDAQINLAGPSTVAITGYFYHFIENQSDAVPVDIWYPTGLENARFDYSIYLNNPSGLGFSPIGFDFPCDSTITILDEAASFEENEFQQLYVYPNPFDNRVNIMANSNISKINLYDIAGKSCEISYLIENSNCTIETETLAAGIYGIAILLADGTNLQTKIIKL